MSDYCFKCGIDYFKNMDVDIAFYFPDASGEEDHSVCERCAADPTLWPPPGT